MVILFLGMLLEHKYWCADEGSQAVASDGALAIILGIVLLLSLCLVYPIISGSFARTRRGNGERGTPDEFLWGA